MFSEVFLAMTAREMEEFLPKHPAYMACHFSPYSAGLSNLPQYLPNGSILLLDDSMPVQGHDPIIAANQLNTLAEQFSVRAILLDFQKEKTPESEDMVSSLLGAVSCPVAATQQYALLFHCPVFLSPCPVNVALEQHLAPWRKEELYLELAKCAMQFSVTEKGCTCDLIPDWDAGSLQLQDERLHCHYDVKADSEKAVFTLQRTIEDVALLAEDAHRLGVQATVGLYQELCK